MPGRNHELDALVTGMQPSGSSCAAASATAAPAAQSLPASSEADLPAAQSDAVLRAVQELLPLLSKSALQKVARTVDKLL